MSRRKGSIKSLGWTRSKYQLGARANLKSLKRYCVEVWAEFVKERDGHTCVICGHTGKYLNSHHIITFKCTHTRYDVNVGITLCAKCHKLGVISAHGTPWILYDWLQIHRPEQYNWFLAHKQDVYLPPLELEKEDYQIILRGLLQLFEQHYPAVLLRSKYYKFTEEEEQTVIKDYVEDEKASLMSIATKYGCGEQALRRILKRKNIPIRKNPGKRPTGNQPKFSKETEEAICKEYLENRVATTRILGKRYECGATTVSAILRRHGIHGWKHK